MGRVARRLRGKGLVLLPAWLRHCGTVSAGTEQVLTKKTGQEERTIEGMAKRREGGRVPLYPPKAAGTCQDQLNHFAFSVRRRDGGTGGPPARFFTSLISVVGESQKSATRNGRPEDVERYNW